MDSVGVPLTGKLLEQGRFVWSLLSGDRPIVSITFGGVYLFESQTGSERKDSGYLSSVLPCRGHRTIVEKSVSSRRRTIIAWANDQLCQPVESDCVLSRNDFSEFFRTFMCMNRPLRWYSLVCADARLYMPRQRHWKIVMFVRMTHTYWEFLSFIFSDSVIFRNRLFVRSGHYPYNSIVKLFGSLMNYFLWLIV